MADDRKPTPRVLLMELSVSGMKLLEVLTDEQKESLKAQFGVESDDALDRALPVLVPVGVASGGPKSVIESNARTRGRFRAIAKDSYDQGHEAIPPEQQKFELKPL